MCPRCVQDSFLSSCFRVREFAIPFAQEQLRETSAVARRGVDDQALARQEQARQITPKDESEADTLSAADLEQTLAATDKEVQEARDLAAKNSALTSRLQLAGEKVGA